MVSTDDLVRHAERAEVLGGQLVAARSAGEKLWRGRLTWLGFSEVSERDECRAHSALLRVFEYRNDVFASLVIVIHLARIYVQVSQDGHRKLICARQVAGVLLLFTQPVLVERGALVDFFEEDGRAGAWRDKRTDPRPPHPRRARRSPCGEREKPTVLSVPSRLEAEGGQ
eukprot:scaffold183818_cov25-Tisochrysis_lutea.AAC.3